MQSNAQYEVSQYRYYMLMRSVQNFDAVNNETGISFPVCSNATH
jgi:hypothetical protein